MCSLMKAFVDGWNKAGKRDKKKRVAEKKRQEAHREAEAKKRKYQHMRDLGYDVDRARRAAGYKPRKKR